MTTTSDRAHMPNVWLGCTVENQKQANLRIPELEQCRNLSPVLWISVAPLLGELDLSHWIESEGFYISDDPRDNKLDSIDWVCIEGESGANARPTPLDHYLRLIHDCQAAGVPVHVKQLSQADHPKTFKDFDSWPPSLQIRGFPKVTH